MLIAKGIYRHFKGKNYEVLGLVHDTESGKPLVLYRGLYESPDLRPVYGDDPWFVRPLEMFKETVEVDGRTVARFELVQENVDEGGE